MADTAIEVRNLCKSFGTGNRALDDINFTVEKGEIVALIGASGSGKSTLIRHIAGLLAADTKGSASEISVLSRTIQAGGRIDTGARTLRSSIGVVFQQFNLVGRLTVLTNVLTGHLGRISRLRGTLGLFTAEEKASALRALDRVGIAERALQRASTLSGGQQQRAAIARTLVQGAEVVLADEPIASLDPASSKRVMDILSEVNRVDGKTVVVSLHQVDYAKTYCPRIIALRDGRIVYDGPGAELTDALLHELYGDADQELFGDRAAVQPEEQTAPVKLPVHQQPAYPEAAVATA